MTRFYVDPLLDRGWEYGPSCHLFTDPGPVAVFHLKRFAVRLRLQPSWLQYKPGRTPHFDLTEKMRLKAILAGAQELGTEEAAKVFRAWRKKEAP